MLLSWVMSPEKPPPNRNSIAILNEAGGTRFQVVVFVFLATALTGACARNTPPLSTSPGGPPQTARVIPKPQAQGLGIATAAPRQSCSFFSHSPPKAIEKVRTAALLVRHGENSGCSGVRVAEDLVLSAAHCALGYDGKTKRGPFFVKSEKARHELTLIETGNFEPSQNKLSDWVLYRAKDGRRALAKHAIAELSPRTEIEDIVNALSGELADRSVAVWTITYPAPGLRIHPRPAMIGRNLFLSRGFLKSHTAYRKSIVLARRSQTIYDDGLELTAPQVPDDWEHQWSSFTKDVVVQMYLKFYRAGQPLLYHSADYAQGSSGGGIFIESTGHLLGIIPMGASVVSRRDAYPGFGQLYRIDVICKESKTLAQLPACGDGVR